ncbi:MAG: PDZ domain-containing protein, partial [Rhodospirillaceae bacterium]|nr:PDZ domain-containing protein [Rhodospirillaceae bacterium]
MTLFKRKIACLFAIACMISVAGSSSVGAQNNPLGLLFGGIIGAVNALNAKQEWKSLDPKLLACMLRTVNPTPDELANQGIGPGDAKIAGKINACYGDAGPPRLGVRLKKVSQQRADAISDILSFNSSDGNTPESLAGALSSVARVDPRGVGGKAGLLAGDVIYKFNGIQVSGDNLAGMVRIAKPAKNYELEVFRDDEMRRVSIKFPSAEVRLAANAEFVRERAARRKAEAEN